MTISFKKSRSSVYPALLDEESSRTHTYLRKNVEEKTEEDISSGTTITYYEYDEAVLTKAEYALYKVSEAAGEDNTEAQLAIAELAEVLEQSTLDIEMAIAELAESLVTE